MPAASPVLFCVVWPLLQAKVKGDIAPLGVKIIEPLFNPQLVATVEVIETAEEAVTVMDALAVQLLALVTVTLYVPAASAEMSSVVDPLFQIKVYGAEAPLGVIFIEPLFSPQLAFVTADEIVTPEEPVTVMDEVAVQLFALVTVTLYVPAASPVLF